MEAAKAQNRALESQEKKRKQFEGSGRGASLSTATEHACQGTQNIARIRNHQGRTTRPELYGHNNQLGFKSFRYVSVYRVAYTDVDTPVISILGTHAPNILHTPWFSVR
jgi:hypothetical protein